jgi:hypothetical protein
MDKLFLPKKIFVQPLHHHPIYDAASARHSDRLTHPITAQCHQTR